MELADPAAYIKPLAHAGGNYDTQLQVSLRPTVGERGAVGYDAQPWARSEATPPTTGAS